MEKFKHTVSETVILRQIRECLKFYGWFVIRIQQGLGCHKGISDLIAVKDGKTVFIEIKKPGGVLSEHQKKFRDDIETHGGKYIVAIDIEDVLAKLKHV